ncbi:uncharacterized protein NEMAJ01_1555 [Nematocida major]|uniref:uncharacterized protein n=1 Tax=Nematocida major TaxID=1912982 RepID=UPI002007B549|nr:uncharacterized protein NEMAJ01_1555 [Nematocida major]KAH9386659.1 hypothetical protein NEMAJ01_1555 [Nematocida major]
MRERLQVDSYKMSRLYFVSGVTGVFFLMACSFCCIEFKNKNKMLGASLEGALKEDSASFQAEIMGCGPCTDVPAGSKELNDVSEEKGVHNANGLSLLDGQDSPNDQTSWVDSDRTSEVLSPLNSPDNGADNSLDSPIEDVNNTEFTQDGPHEEVGSEYSEKEKSLSEELTDAEKTFVHDPSKSYDDWVDIKRIFDGLQDKTFLNLLLELGPVLSVKLQRLQSIQKSFEEYSFLNSIPGWSEEIVVQAIKFIEKVAPTAGPNSLTPNKNMSISKPVTVGDALEIMEVLQNCNLPSENACMEIHIESEESKSMIYTGIIILLNNPQIYADLKVFEYDFIAEVFKKKASRRTKDDPENETKYNDRCTELTEIVSKLANIAKALPGLPTMDNVDSRALDELKSAATLLEKPKIYPVVLEKECPADSPTYNHACDVYALLLRTIREFYADCPYWANGIRVAGKQAVRSERSIKHVFPKDFSAPKETISATSGSYLKSNSSKIDTAGSLENWSWCNIIYVDNEEQTAMNIFLPLYKNHFTIKHETIVSYISCMYGKPEKNIHAIEICRKTHSCTYIDPQIGHINVASSTAPTVFYYIKEASSPDADVKLFPFIFQQPKDSEEGKMGSDAYSLPLFLNDLMVMSISLSAYTYTNNEDIEIDEMDPVRCLKTMNNLAPRVLDFTQKGNGSRSFCYLEMPGFHSCPKLENKDTNVAGISINIDANNPKSKDTVECTAMIIERGQTRNIKYPEVGISQVISQDMCGNSAHVIFTIFKGKHKTNPSQSPNNISNESCKRFFSIKNVLSPRQNKSLRSISLNSDLHIRYMIMQASPRAQKAQLGLLGSLTYALIHLKQEQITAPI